MMSNLDPSTQERFWAKVDQRGPNDCWEWTASGLKSGYGSFGVNGKMELAHRVAWTLANGEIPDGLCVCHSCDNPPCVNAAHLFLGTQADNLADMRAKGRQGYYGLPGEKHPKAKLTERDVRFIRHWLSKGYTEQSTADAFGVCRKSICHNKTGSTWSHVSEESRAGA